MTAACADTAVLVVAHGERAEGSRNRTLRAHADGLRARLTVPVSAAVLRGEPDLDGVLAQFRDAGVRRLIVYPFFMSDGYFVRTLLPQRLRELVPSGIDIVMLEPLGCDPALPELMRCDAVATAEANGLTPASIQLMVVGHGSKLSGASARATRAITDSIARSATFKSVQAVFLEEPPFLSTELASIKIPFVIAGLFSGEGLHAAVDVEAAILETGAPAHYTGPIGANPGVLDIIERAVKHQLPAK